MAKKKPKKQPFYVQGMTTKEILDITPDVLMRLSERDVSRALRTVALAANKRIRRLVKAVEEERPVAHDALRWSIEKNTGKAIGTGKLSSSKTLSNVPVFGVKQAGNKSAMIKQIGEIRRLFNMKTSTVSGALTVKQKREKMLFGATRQELAAGMNKKDRANFYRRLNRRYDKTWEFYKKYQELQGRDPHSLIEGSAEILNSIGSKVLSGERNEQEILKEALKAETNIYEDQQAEYNDMFDNFDFWSM